MDAREAFLKLRFGTKFDSRRSKSDEAKIPIIGESRLKRDNALDPEKEPIADEEFENITPAENDQISDDHESGDEQIHLTKDILSRREQTSVKKARKKRRKKSDNGNDERRREAISQFRKQKRIYVWGTDVPDPCASFTSMIDRYNIPTDLASTMGKLLSSWTPTPIQMQAIPVMMEGREILASAPTGSGKTLAFLIPLLSHLKKPEKGGFRAVIVEPTRELAKQVYREALRMNEQLGLRIHMITSLDVAKEKFGPHSKRRLDVLISTPNRLVHLLNQDPPCLDLSKVEWLIVDESDKLFETGTRGFRDQLAIIHQACDESRCRRAFFSATFSYDVEQWCKAYLNNVITVSIGARNTAASTVEQELLFVGSEYGKIVALRGLINHGLLPPILVFVQTKERAEELYSEMVHLNLKVGVIHSDKDRKVRDETVKRFRAGDLWFLICTELMGRGMDFKNVNIVINYDFPPSAISYIHRIGRTGRAGRPGKAITFFTEYDRPLLRSVANVVRESGGQIPDYMLQLHKPRKQLQGKLTRHCAQRPNVTVLRDQGKNRKRRVNGAAKETYPKKFKSKKSRMTEEK